MKRVAFVIGAIMPYRATFFEKLSRNPEIELRVYRSDPEVRKHRAFAGKKALHNVSHLDLHIEDLKEFCLKVGSFFFQYQRGGLSRLKKYDPDVIILSGNIGILSNWIILRWAKRTNRPVIMWCCGWEAQNRDTLGYKIKAFLMRRYYKKPSRILTYSTKASAYLQNLGVSSEKFDVCYNGVEIDDVLLQEDAVRAKAKELLISEQVEDRVVLLYVGALTARKRLDLLLEAFAKWTGNKEAVLWIVGDSPAADAYKQRVKELGLSNVKFWGRIIDGVDTFFAAADCFVMPGIGGLALNQAMFWGTPCICADADGTEEDLVIDSKTGMRFESDQVDSLVDAIASVAGLDVTKRIEMGNASRQLILHQSNVSLMVDTFFRAIKHVATRSGH